VTWPIEKAPPKEIAFTTICWSDTAVADIGDWNGMEFANGKPVPGQADRLEVETRSDADRRRRHAGRSAHSGG